MKKYPFVCFVIILVLVLFAKGNFAFAHSTGESFEKVVSGYKVDVGYDPVEFIAGESNRLDFRLANEATNEAVEFTDIWVNIRKGNQNVFASGIYNKYLIGAGMTFIFPEAGEYILSVRYENKDKNIVEAIFPIKVLPKVLENESENSAPASSNEKNLLFASGIIGIIVGAVGYRVIVKNK